MICWGLDHFPLVKTEYFSAVRFPPLSVACYSPSPFTIHPPFFPFSSAATQCIREGDSSGLFLFGPGMVRKWLSLQWEPCKRTLNSFPAQITFQPNDLSIGFQKTVEGLRNQTLCENKTIQAAHVLNELCSNPPHNTEWWLLLLYLCWSFLSCLSVTMNAQGTTEHWKSQSLEKSQFFQKLPHETAKKDDNQEFRIKTHIFLKEQT